MVRADSGINTPKDLEGHTLGDAAGFVTLQVFPAFEAATGIDSSKVKKVTVDATARTTAFLARQYDVLSAIAFGEPVQARLQHNTDIKCMMFSDYGVNIMGFGIVASQQMIDQKPEIVKAFVRASTKGYAYAFAHPEEAALVLRKRMPDPTGLAGDNVTVEVIRVLSTMGTAETEGKPYGYMPDSLWVKTVDVLKKYADLDPATDPKALYTNFAFQ
jgi:NitT/TauT family transport system substrate-binding protein